MVLAGFVIGGRLKQNLEFWYLNSMTISGSTVLSVLMQLLSSRYRLYLNSAQEESERERHAAEENLASFQAEARQREHLQERLAHADTRKGWRAGPACRRRRTRLQQSVGHRHWPRQSHAGTRSHPEDAWRT